MAGVHESTPLFPQQLLNDDESPAAYINRHCDGMDTMDDLQCLHLAQTLKGSLEASSEASAHQMNALIDALLRVVGRLTYDVDAIELDASAFSTSTAVVVPDSQLKESSGDKTIQRLEILQLVANRMQFAGECLADVSRWESTELEAQIRERLKAADVVRACQLTDSLEALCIILHGTALYQPRSEELQKLRASITQLKNAGPQAGSGTNERVSQVTEEISAASGGYQSFLKKFSTGIRDK